MIDYCCCRSLCVCDAAKIGYVSILNQSQHNQYQIAFHTTDDVSNIADQAMDEVQLSLNRWNEYPGRSLAGWLSHALPRIKNFNASMQSKIDTISTIPAGCSRKVGNCLYEMRTSSVLTTPHSPENSSNPWNTSWESSISMT
eukprot:m.126919 g.126919  ORF g.126919 m.126919 type:complete len:142 (-) comp13846_c1_seq3:77-502(-)